MTEPGAPPEPITRDCPLNPQRVQEQIDSMQARIRERFLRKKEEKG